MRSPEMQPPVSECIETPVKSKTPLIEVQQNALIITIDDRNIVVPRKELYGIPDIGYAIGSDNPSYIRLKLWIARKNNPDINPQYRAIGKSIGKSYGKLFLPEKDFVLAVTAIIPTIKGEDGSRQKESITLPDGQTITVRGEKPIRTLKLLITAFNQGKPHVPNEEFLGLDVTKGIPISPMQTKSLRNAVYRLKYKKLTGTGWTIKNITVRGKGVETRPKGYVLKKDKDAPTLLLQSILGNKTVLEKAKQQINSLDPQEKVLFLEKTFAILSDPNPEYQNERDAALDILRVIDLTSLDRKKLEKTYVKAVSNLREDLNQDSDLYGEIDALLEAGKIIAPFIENSRAITQVWKHVAKVFTGDDHQKILDDIKEIKQLIPKTLSEFDIKVATLIKERLRNQEIAAKLSVTILEIKQSVSRLSNKGVKLKSFHRARGKMQTEQDKQLFEEVKGLRREGMGNLEISYKLTMPLQRIDNITHTLIARGEISRIKKSGPKKNIMV